MLIKNLIFVLIVFILIISGYLIFNHKRELCADYAVRGFESRDKCTFQITKETYEKYKEAKRYEEINFTFCDGLTNESVKDLCFNYTASLQFLKPYKMPLCAKIANESIKNSCYTTVCYEFDDSDCCDEVSDEGQKNACIKLVALKLQNVELCKKAGNLRFECCSKILCPNPDKNCIEKCSE